MVFISSPLPHVKAGLCLSEIYHHGGLGHVEEVCSGVLAGQTPKKGLLSFLQE